LEKSDFSLSQALVSEPDID